MLNNFREIYDKELEHYEHEGGLTMLILNSTEIRAFVYEVCKACVASQPEDAAETCELHEHYRNCDTYMKYCPECGELFR